MILVASSLPEENFSDFAVVVVGAGAVGVALAARLASRVGRIALVEAGGPKLEARVQKQYFKPDRVSDPRHPSTELYRRRMLGGTTSVWGGRCIPLDREDYSSSLRAPAWPIPYEEVAPWMDDALQFLHAGHDDFSIDVLPESARSPAVDGIRDPDLELDRIERFSEPTNVWRRWGQTLVKSQNIVVLQGAACTNIRTDADGRRAVGIDLRTDEGRSIKINASAVVLACGGLETPRLLLASRDRLSCGLGNENDLVGRYYMTHLGGTTGFLKLRDPGANRCFDYATTSDGVYGRRLIRLTPEARKRENIANMVFRPNIHTIFDPSHGDSILSAMAFAKKLVIPEYSRKLFFGETEGARSAVLMRHGRNIAGGLPRLASFGFDWLRRRTFATRKLPSVFLLRSDATYPIAFDAEQSPDFNSRVSLGPNRDPNGVPRLDIQWRVDDVDLNSIARGYHVLKKAAERAGLGRVDFEHEIIADLREAVGPVGGHHMGTTRMGSDPKTSVTDGNGELWNTKGVFVAGSALFPATGFANPTLTAVALGLRMADHLLKNLAGRRAAAEARM